VYVYVYFCKAQRYKLNAVIDTLVFRLRRLSPQLSVDPNIEKAHHASDSSYWSPRFDENRKNVIGAVSASTPEYFLSQVDG